MSDPRNHHALIDALGAELAPVRRLPPPWRRAAGWLLVVAAIAAALFAHYGPEACCGAGRARRTWPGPASARC